MSSFFKKKEIKRYNANMADELLILVSLFVSVGSITFLIQNTDFIYEYTSLFLRISRLKYVDKFLKLDQYEQNSNIFENYISFIGSVVGTQKSIAGFISRLITCFLCLNCFASIVLSILIFDNFILYAFPCFVGAVSVYYSLFAIKKKIFE